jgi:hypothetical protein
MPEYPGRRTVANQEPAWSVPHAGALELLAVSVVLLLLIAGLLR